MQLRGSRRRWVLIGSVILVLGACSMYQVDRDQRRQYREANALLHRQGDSTGRYLKAHLADGDLIIFRPAWRIDTVARRITGAGLHYNMDRVVVDDGPQEVPFDRIAILETNEPLRSRDANYRTTLVTISVIDGLLAGFCAFNPKACFGSCPTFYLPHDQGLFAARAEGFSSAIYPALQYADIDQLGTWSDSCTPPTVIMRNEALETQVIDRLGLIAFPEREGEEVRQTPDDRFLRCSAPAPCRTARFEGAKVADALRADDGAEWWSRANSADLRTTGVLELSFDRQVTGATPALALTFRQTLLTTFLLYTALGYMGDEVSDHIARLETDRAMRKRTGRALDALQEIRVEALVNGRWQEVGTVRETGPIARNRIVVPLPAALAEAPQVQLRLQFTPGMYRLDQAALVDVCGEAHGMRLEPVSVQHHGGRPVSVDAIRAGGDARKLCTLPGDAHTVTFARPMSAGKPMQLFLVSEGYYLEWMRREWLEETDPDRLRAMLLGRDSEWEALTREYKAMEEGMDAVFWNSQWTTPL